MYVPSRFPGSPGGRKLRVSTHMAAHYCTLICYLSLLASTSWPLTCISWDNHPNIGTQELISGFDSQEPKRRPQLKYRDKGSWEGPGAGHGEGQGNQGTVSGGRVQVEGGRGQIMQTPMSPCLVFFCCGNSLVFTWWLKTLLLSYIQLWKPEVQNGPH